MLARKLLLWSITLRCRSCDSFRYFPEIRKFQNSNSFIYQKHCNWFLNSDGSFNFAHGAYRNHEGQESCMLAVPPYIHVKCSFQRLYKPRPVVDVRIGSSWYNAVYIFAHPIKQNRFKQPGKIPFIHGLYIEWEIGNAHWNKIVHHLNHATIPLIHLLGWFSPWHR